MLKRKFGDRAGWQRVISRDYNQIFLEAAEFKGYITILQIHKVKGPSYVNYDEKEVCIVDDGYMWLQHFPKNNHYSVTTMFNAEGEIVQWYIDICRENGIEDGRPWMDDLFLDIVVLPTGEVHLKDADELEEALKHGHIDQFLYDLAWTEAKRLINLINGNQFELLMLAKDHKKLLLEGMT